MFTGLITGVGRIRAVSAIGNGQDARFTIETPPTRSGAGRRRSSAPPSPVPASA
ncbi:hypothetical protein [Acidocella sp. MX-AZ03]|uniref:hypothetical protein n=1 Tax=Acidocella sp. MX-AZ03 TaxID=2697363 RepID=UPI003FA4C7B9